MKEGIDFLRFTKEKGRPLSEINPGSDEIALRIDDALHAIDLLQGTQWPILGGDILADESGELVYTYDNWYCERLNNESQKDHADRSYKVAKEYLAEIADRLGKGLFVVIVT